jgi:hypothetical protein
VLLFLGGVGLGVLLERGRVFDRRGIGPDPASNDTAVLIVGKWQPDDDLSSYNAAARWSSRVRRGLRACE